MLLISAFFSTILLCIALATVWRGAEPGQEPTRKSSVTPLVTCAIFAPIGVLCLGVFLPALALQAFLLVIVASVWSGANWTAQRFAVLAIGATVVAYGIVGAVAAYNVFQFQQQYPLVSLEERLPRPPQQNQAVAESRLEHIEALLDQTSNNWLDSMRSRHLQQLHENTVRVFANRPGFGVARVLDRPSEWSLRRGLRDDQPLPQPGDRITVLWSTGDLEARSAPTISSDHEASRELHSSSLIDFVHLRGFGYARDRNQVAGFQSHRFSQAPPAPAEWTLRTIDLIGLVRHDQPVAYVSANLPQMEELRDAAWRPLDDFENLGLESFRKGEDMFVRDGSGGRRLLGAIRNTKQCVTCHGGARGDLLGAFSYTLTPGR